MPQHHTRCNHIRGIWMPAGAPPRRALRIQRHSQDNRVNLFIKLSQQYCTKSVRLFGTPSDRTPPAARRYTSAYVPERFQYGSFARIHNRGVLFFPADSIGLQQKQPDRRVQPYPREIRRTAVPLLILDGEAGPNRLSAEFARFTSVNVQPDYARPPNRARRILDLDHGAENWPQLHGLIRS